MVGLLFFKQLYSTVFVLSGYGLYAPKAISRPQFSMLAISGSNSAIAITPLWMGVFVQELGQI